MADIAVFSSFRRPGAQRSEALLDRRPPAATIPIQPSTPAPVATAQVDMTERDTGPAAGGPKEANGTSGPSTHSSAEPFCSTWRLSGVGLGADQLGLAHPDVILLQARLRGTSPVLLEASTAGIYRPPGFRPAPWSGFAYDQPEKVSTGLAAGTRILTVRGEVEVEKLVPGDVAMALRGPALLPISWIGRTTALSATILIEPGALGPDLPRRALHLGPDQGVFLGPAPVAAQTLVNGTTIRVATATLSELFHVDVGRAEIILAEGLALSSSRDASKRG